ncbi:autotransporter outer membrane beta-barrel domain-containing protein [Sphingomonas sp. MMS24-JH45]
MQTTVKSDGSDGTARLRSSRTGFMGGLDYIVSGVRITGFGGWQDSDVALRDRGANADVKTTFAGAAAAWTGGPLTPVQAGGLLAWHDVETRRALPTSGFGTATARPDANGAELFADVAYSLTSGPVTVAPFLRNAYVRTRVDAYAETGSTAALTVARGQRDIGILAAGVRVGGSAPLGSATLAPRLSVAYERAYGDDLDGVAVQRIGGGVAFTVTGAGYGKSGVTGDAGFDLLLGRFSVGVAGFGSTSGRWSDYGGRAQLGYRF